ncbi:MULTISPECIES: hypothetical protein [unclassified Novosphingobium]|uniref:hypothetical protein n=1 Tax=unclassified Novosphingobium TaxID=2644732 RepID=UPI0025DE6B90|nr:MULTISPECIES: hypothetical protein [unclassified Novosphingobium]HQV02989.1 hypothetical protein [Novosphingobium sp.]
MMARFDEQPFVTSEMWWFFFRVVAWCAVAAVAQHFGNRTDSLVFAGLCGFVMGLSLFIIAWNHERIDDELESSRNGKFGLFAQYLVVTLLIAGMLWVSYQQVVDGISTSTTFFWGYIAGLGGVGFASSRGYLKSRSNT